MKAIAAFVVVILAVCVNATRTDAGTGALYRIEWAEDVIPIADPGPKPDPGDLSVYDPYLKGGHATLIVNGSVIFKPGVGERGLQCASGAGLLYPDTPYTRWLLGWFANMVHTHDALPRFQELLRLRVPKVLDLRNKDAAIRSASCTSNGTLRFLNVPPGDYIAGITVQGTGSVTVGGYTDEWVNGIGAPIGEGEYHPAETFAVPADGYLLLGGPYHVRIDEGIYFGGQMHVASHFGFGDYQ